MPICIFFFAISSSNRVGFYCCAALCVWCVTEIFNQFCTVSSLQLSTGHGHIYHYYYIPTAHTHHISIQMYLNGINQFSAWLIYFYKLIGYINFCLIVHVNCCHHKPPPPQAAATGCNALISTPIARGIKPPSGLDGIVDIWRNNASRAYFKQYHNL